MKLMISNLFCCFSILFFHYTFCLSKIFIIGQASSMNSNNQNNLKRMSYFSNEAYSCFLNTKEMCSNKKFYLIIKILKNFILVISIYLLILYFSCIYILRSQKIRYLISEFDFLAVFLKYLQYLIDFIFIREKFIYVLLD